MRKSFLVVICAIVFAACNNNENKDDKTNPATENDTVSENKKEEPVNTFDINAIPVSQAEIGSFPYVSFPKGLAAQNTPIQKSFDVLYFPLGGVMTPVEGKVWKSFVTNSKENKEEWSADYFLKAYDDSIKKYGGVKIFDGKVTKEEADKFYSNAKYAGEEGSIDYRNEAVRAYIIRRPKGDDIYIQMYAHSATGAIQVLQKQANDNPAVQPTTSK